MTREDINEGEILVVAIEQRNVYGNKLFYPSNEVAKLFCRIAGRKTLSKWDLEQLDNSLNFVVKEEWQQVLNWEGK